MKYKVLIAEYVAKMLAAGLGPSDEVGGGGLACDRAPEAVEMSVWAGRLSHRDQGPEPP